MKRTSFIARLQPTRRTTALFSTLGLIAVASFTAMGVADASGYSVTIPVREFFGILAAPTTVHNGTLDGSRVTNLEGGRIVVSTYVAGGFKGLLSVWIQTDGSAVTGGDWALVHAYSEDAGDGHGEHSEGENFVNKGTLSGKITGGGISLDPQGNLASLNALQLSLTSGSLTYDGVQGYGSVSLSDAGSEVTSTGTITLDF